MVFKLIAISTGLLGAQEFFFLKCFLVPKKMAAFSCRCFNCQCRCKALDAFVAHDGISFYVLLSCPISRNNTKGLFNFHAHSRLKLYSSLKKHVAEAVPLHNDSIHMWYYLIVLSMLEKFISSQDLSKYVEFIY